MTRLEFPYIPVEVMTHHDDSTGTASVWIAKGRPKNPAEDIYTCIIGYMVDDFIPEDIIEDHPSGMIINWCQELFDLMPDCEWRTGETPARAIGYAIVDWYNRSHKNSNLSQNKD